MSKCPICKKEILPRPQNPFVPFCSSRCRQVDLGRWLDGNYRIPVVEDEDEDGGGPSAYRDDAG